MHQSWEADHETAMEPDRFLQNWRISPGTRVALSGGMTTDVSVIVADLKRLGSIKSTVRPSGRTLYFSSGNLVAAMESIRSLRPKLIGIDALFARTSPGAAFHERVET